MAAARLFYLARPSLHIMNTMRYVRIHSIRRNTYLLHRFYLIPHCVSYTLHFLITRAPLPHFVLASVPLSPWRWMGRYRKGPEHRIYMCRSAHPSYVRNICDIWNSRICYEYPMQRRTISAQLKIHHVPIRQAWPLFVSRKYVTGTQLRHRLNVFGLIYRSLTTSSVSISRISSPHTVEVVEFLAHNTTYYSRQTHFVENMDRYRYQCGDIWKHHIWQKRTVLYHIQMHHILPTHQQNKTTFSHISG